MEKFEPVKNIDVIPEGTFFSELSGEQKIGIKNSIISAFKIQETIPTLADDFIKGSTLEQLVKKYDLESKLNCSYSTAINTVRIALVGYGGNMTFLEGEVPTFSGLIDKETYDNIVKERMTNVGKKAFFEKKGIHAQTIDEQKELGRLLSESQGKTVFSDEEIDFLKIKITDPEYQRKSRINAKKLSELLNQKFHGGREVRTPQSVKKISSRLKTGDRN